MIFDNETLKTAAELGSKEASNALAKLSHAQVVTSVSEVVFVPADKITTNLSIQNEIMPIVAYSQTISGVDGVSILSMTRDEALNLIDLLNEKPIGTTGVLMDIDRSAIKEVLNIISNSFLNSLAKNSKINLLFSNPHLISALKIKEIFDKLSKTNDDIVIFRTHLEIANHNVKAQLYLIFNNLNS